MTPHRHGLALFALGLCAGAQPPNATISAALRKLTEAPPLVEVVSCSASVSVWFKWCSPTHGAPQTCTRASRMVQDTVSAMDVYITPSSFSHSGIEIVHTEIEAGTQIDVHPITIIGDKSAAPIPPFAMEFVQFNSAGSGADTIHTAFENQPSVKPPHSCHPRAAFQNSFIESRDATWRGLPVKVSGRDDGPGHCLQRLARAPAPCTPRYSASKRGRPCRVLRPFTDFT